MGRFSWGGVIHWNTRAKIKVLGNSPVSGQKEKAVNSNPFLQTIFVADMRIENSPVSVSGFVVCYRSM